MANVNTDSPPNEFISKRNDHFTNNESSEEIKPIESPLINFLDNYGMNGSEDLIQTKVFEDHPLLESNSQNYTMCDNKQNTTTNNKRTIHVIN